MPTNVPCVHSWSHDTHRGGSPVPATLWSACPSVMVLHFFLYEGTPLSETAYTSVKCYWEMKGSVLNCHRNVRWTEATDSCFTNCSTQNAFCSGVAIIAVLRHRPRGESDCARAENLNTCCFVPCGKLTSACVFKAVDGRLKPLQLFWYTLYLCLRSYCVRREVRCFKGSRTGDLRVSVYLQSCWDA